jgi:hypothetical protein
LQYSAIAFTDLRHFARSLLSPVLAIRTGFFASYKKSIDIITLLVLLFSRSGGNPGISERKAGKEDSPTLKNVCGTPESNITARYSTWSTTLGMVYSSNTKDKRSLFQPIDRAENTKVTLR